MPNCTAPRAGQRIVTDAQQCTTLASQASPIQYHCILFENRPYRRRRQGPKNYNTPAFPIVCFATLIYLLESQFSPLLF